MNAPSKKPTGQTVEDELNELDQAHTTLHGAMALAFAEIEGATKAALNPHFGKKYADIGAVIDAIKPPLIKHGLFFTQRNQPSQDGVIVETVLHHRSGEEMVLGSLYVPADQRSAQKYGSALTYARRYALMTAFGVPAEDDDGNAASATPAPPATRQERIAEHKDDPFPLGPAKNKTELKEKGRAFWRDVEACGDSTELECLLADKNSVQLVNQIMKALPSWWDGGKDGNGETFEGLEAVIERKRRDFNQMENA